MSLPKKSVHVRLTDEMHGRLSVLAELSHDDISEHAAFLLEKGIVADFHVVSLQGRAFQRLGLAGTEREREGGGR